MKSLNKFVKKHRKANDNLRLGQRFFNLYIKHPWPELFYMTNDTVALAIIEDWLNDHQYYDELPNEVI